MENKFYIELCNTYKLNQQVNDIGEPIPLSVRLDRFQACLDEIHSSLDDDTISLDEVKSAAFEQIKIDMKALLSNAADLYLQPGYEQLLIDYVKKRARLLELQLQINAKIHKKPTTTPLSKDIDVEEARRILSESYSTKFSMLVTHEIINFNFYKEMFDKTDLSRHEAKNLAELINESLQLTEQQRYDLLRRYFDKFKCLQLNLNTVSLVGVLEQIFEKSATDWPKNLFIADSIDEQEVNNNNKEAAALMKALSNYYAEKAKSSWYSSNAENIALAKVDVMYYGVNMVIRGEDPKVKDQVGRNILEKYIGESTVEVDVLIKLVEKTLNNSFNDKIHRNEAIMSRIIYFVMKNENISPNDKKKIFASFIVKVEGDDFRDGTINDLSSIILKYRNQNAPLDINNIFPELEQEKYKEVFGDNFLANLNAKLKIDANQVLQQQKTEPQVLEKPTAEGNNVKFDDIKEENHEPKAPTILNNVNLDITLVTGYTTENSNRLKMSQKVVKNQQGYATKQGYKYLEYKSNLAKGYEPYWSKIAIINAWLDANKMDGSNKWLVWLDDDMIIMDSSIKAEDLINKYAKNDESVIVAKDALAWNGDSKTSINTGILFVKNTQQSREFFQNIWDKRNDKFTSRDGITTTLGKCEDQICLHEQAAMAELLKDEKDKYNYVSVIDQRGDDNVGVNTFIREKFYYSQKSGQEYYSSYYSDPDNSIASPGDFAAQFTGIPITGKRVRGEEDSNLRLETAEVILKTVDALTDEEKRQLREERYSNLSPLLKKIKDAFISRDFSKGGKLDKVIDEILRKRSNAYAVSETDSSEKPVETELTVVSGVKIDATVDKLAELGVKLFEKKLSDALDVLKNTNKGLPETEEALETYFLENHFNNIQEKEFTDIFSTIEDKYSIINVEKVKDKLAYIRSNLKRMSQYSAFVTAVTQLKENNYKLLALELIETVSSIGVTSNDLHAAPYACGLDPDNNEVIKQYANLIDVAKSSAEAFLFFKAQIETNRKKLENITQRLGAADNVQDLNKIKSEAEELLNKARTKLSEDITVLAHQKEANKLRRGIIQELDPVILQAKRAIDFYEAVELKVKDYTKENLSIQEILQIKLQIQGINKPEGITNIDQLWQSAENDALSKRFDKATQEIKNKIKSLNDKNSPSAKDLSNFDSEIKGFIGDVNADGFIKTIEQQSQLVSLKASVDSAKKTAQEKIDVAVSRALEQQKKDSIVQAETNFNYIKIDLSNNDKSWFSEINDKLTINKDEAYRSKFLELARIKLAELAADRLFENKLEEAKLALKDVDTVISDKGDELKEYFLSKYFSEIQDDEIEDSKIKSLIDTFKKKFLITEDKNNIISGPEFESEFTNKLKYIKRNQLVNTNKKYRAYIDAVKLHNTVVQEVKKHIDKISADTVATDEVNVQLSLEVLSTNNLVVKELDSAKKSADALLVFKGKIKKNKKQLDDLKPRLSSSNSVEALNQVDSEAKVLLNIVKLISSNDVKLSRHIEKATTLQAGLIKELDDFIDNVKSKTELYNLKKSLDEKIRLLETSNNLQENIDSLETSLKQVPVQTGDSIVIVVELNSIKLKAESIIKFYNEIQEKIQKYKDPDLTINQILALKNDIATPEITDYEKVIDNINNLLESAEQEALNKRFDKLKQEIESKITDLQKDPVPVITNFESSINNWLGELENDNFSKNKNQELELDQLKDRIKLAKAAAEKKIKDANLQAIATQKSAAIAQAEKEFKEINVKVKLSANVNGWLDEINKKLKNSNQDYREKFIDLVTTELSGWVAKKTNEITVKISELNAADGLSESYINTLSSLVTFDVLPEIMKNLPSIKVAVDKLTSAKSNANKIVAFYEKLQKYKTEITDSLEKLKSRFNTVNNIKDLKNIMADAQELLKNLNAKTFDDNTTNAQKGEVDKLKQELKENIDNFIKRFKDKKNELIKDVAESKKKEYEKYHLIAENIADEPEVFVEFHYDHMLRLAGTNDFSKTDIIGDDIILIKQERSENYGKNNALLHALKKLHVPGMFYGSSQSTDPTVISNILIQILSHTGADNIINILVGNSIYNKEVFEKILAASDLNESIKNNIIKIIINHKHIKDADKYELLSAYINLDNKMVFNTAELSNLVAIYKNRNINANTGHQENFSNRIVDDLTAVGDIAEFNKEVSKFKNDIKAQQDILVTTKSLGAWQTVNDKVQQLVFQLTDRRNKLIGLLTGLTTNLPLMPTTDILNSLDSKKTEILNTLINLNNQAVLDELCKKSEHAVCKIKDDLKRDFATEDIASLDNIITINLNLNSEILNKFTQIIKSDNDQAAIDVVVKSSLDNKIFDENYKNSLLSDKIKKLFKEINAITSDIFAENYQTKNIDLEILINQKIEQSEILQSIKLLDSNKDALKQQIIADYTLLLENFNGLTKNFDPNKAPEQLKNKYLGTKYENIYNEKVKQLDTLYEQALEELKKSRVIIKLQQAKTSEDISQHKENALKLITSDDFVKEYPGLKESHFKTIVDAFEKQATDSIATETATQTIEIEAEKIAKQYFEYIKGLSLPLAELREKVLKINITDVENNIPLEKPEVLLDLKFQNIFKTKLNDLYTKEKPQIVESLLKQAAKLILEEEFNNQIEDIAGITVNDSLTSKVELFKGIISKVLRNINDNVALFQQKMLKEAKLSQGDLIDTKEIVQALTATLDDISQEITKESDFEKFVNVKIGSNPDTIFPYLKFINKIEEISKAIEKETQFKQQLAAKATSIDDAINLVLTTGLIEDNLLLFRIEDLTEKIKSPVTEKESADSNLNLSINRGKDILDFYNNIQEMIEQEALTNNLANMAKCDKIESLYKKLSKVDQKSKLISELYQVSMDKIKDAIKLYDAKAAIVIKLTNLEIALHALKNPDNLNNSIDSLQALLNEVPDENSGLKLAAQRIIKLYEDIQSNIPQYNNQDLTITEILQIRQAIKTPDENEIASIKDKNIIIENINQLCKKAEEKALNNRFALVTGVVEAKIKELIDNSKNEQIQRCFDELNVADFEKTKEQKQKLTKLQQSFEDAEIAANEKIKVGELQAVAIQRAKEQAAIKPNIEQIHSIEDSDNQDDDKAISPTYLKEYAQFLINIMYINLMRTLNSHKSDKNFNKLINKLMFQAHMWFDVSLSSDLKTTEDILQELTKSIQEVNEILREMEVSQKEQKSTNSQNEDVAKEDIQKQKEEELRKEFENSQRERKTKTQLEKLQEYLKENKNADSEMTQDLFKCILSYAHLFFMQNLIRLFNVKYEATPLSNLVDLDNLEFNVKNLDFLIKQGLFNFGYPIEIEHEQYENDKKFIHIFEKLPKDIKNKIIQDFSKLLDIYKRLNQIILEVSAETDVKIFSEKIKNIKITINRAGVSMTIDKEEFEKNIEDIDATYIAEHFGWFWDQCKSIAKNLGMSDEEVSGLYQDIFIDNRLETATKMTEEEIINFIAEFIAKTDPSFDFDREVDAIRRGIIFKLHPDRVQGGATKKTSAAYLFVQEATTNNALEGFIVLLKTTVENLLKGNVVLQKSIAEEIFNLFEINNLDKNKMLYQLNSFLKTCIDKGDASCSFDKIDDNEFKDIIETKIGYEKPIPKIIFPEVVKNLRILLQNKKDELTIDKDNALKSAENRYSKIIGSVDLSSASIEQLQKFKDQIDSFKTTDGFEKDYWADKSQSLEHSIRLKEVALAATPKKTDLDRIIEKVKESSDLNILNNNVNWATNKIQNEEIVLNNHDKRLVSSTIKDTTVQLVVDVYNNNDDPFQSARILKSLEQKMRIIRSSEYLLENDKKDLTNILRQYSHNIANKIRQIRGG